MQRGRPLVVAQPIRALERVFIFPPLEDSALQTRFDPACIGLVTEVGDASTTVACLLGFFKVVCGQGYLAVLEATHRDGILLEEVHVSEAFIQRQLGTTDSPNRETMDDFYVLLSVMLCNLPRAPGSNLGTNWSQNRIKDLVQIFPNISSPPRVPLYQAGKADAIARFSHQYPHTRAALCNSLLKGRFQGPMAHLQEYVSMTWRFAGMKHVQLIVDFLKDKYAWVLDIIPELHAKGYRLRNFLKAYQRLGADGPYMRLLNLPEAATSLRKHLGPHVAAAYALAILEDDNWLKYKGVPRDQEEEAVFSKITDIRKMALGAPKLDQGGAGDSADVHPFP